MMMLVRLVFVDGFRWRRGIRMRVPGILRPVLMGMHVLVLVRVHEVAVSMLVRVFVRVRMHMRLGWFGCFVGHDASPL